MSVPTAGQRRLVIVGATGMVGGYALGHALNHPGVASATVIGRWKFGISHPKLKELLHRDFTDCSALAEPLSRQDAVVLAGRGKASGRSVFWTCGAATAIEYALPVRSPAASCS